MLPTMYDAATSIYSFSKAHTGEKRYVLCVSYLVKVQCLLFESWEFIVDGYIFELSSCYIC